MAFKRLLIIAIVLAMHERPTDSQTIQTIGCVQKLLTSKLVPRAVGRSLFCFQNRTISRIGVIVRSLGHLGQYRKGFNLVKFNNTLQDVQLSLAAVQGTPTILTECWIISTQQFVDVIERFRRCNG